MSTELPRDNEPVQSGTGSDTLPQPPEPFSSWVDFAIAQIPVRELELEDMFAEDAPRFVRDDFRRAAQAELDALRARAGDPDTFPASFRAPPVVRGRP